MRARSILVFLGLAMFAGIVWFARRMDEGPPNAPADSAVRTTSQVEAGDLRDAFAAPPAVESGERIDVAASSPTADDVAFVADAIHETRRPRVELRVLEFGTQTPVEGAQVLIFEGRQSSFPVLLRRGPIDAANATQVLVTDVDGRVSLLRPNDGATAFARKDGRSGYVTIDSATPASIDVQVMLDGELEVSVVDLGGAPLEGIPVTLLRRFHGFRFDYGEVLSDARGIARLPHARMLTTRWSKPTEWFAAVRGVFEVPLQRPITAQHFEGEVLQLAVPPVGRCDVEVRDARGELETSPFEICLDVDRGGKESNSTSVAPRDDAIWTERTTRGAAQFPIVQLGVSLRALARHTGSDAKLDVRGPGPIEPNARVVLTVRTAESACVITGRVVFPSSVQSSTAPLRATLRSTMDRSTERLDVEVTLDQTSRFRALFAPLDETPAHEFVLCTTDEAHSNGLIARVALPDELRSGEHDVGELHFVDAPVLAAGVVLDSAGRGVAEASVSVLTASGEGSSEWDAAKTFAERSTDASGRFEVRASVAPERFRVLAVRGTTWVESETLTAATEHVVLQLASSGSIAAVVLLDETIDVRALQLVAERTDSDERERYDARRCSDSRPAVFEFQHVPVGEYSILVRDLGETTCARIDGVLVTSDEVTRDRRLDPLDLRADLRLIEVTITSDANRPLAGVWAVTRTSWPDGRVEIVRPSWITTKTSFVCGRDGLDLRVGAARHAEVELLGVQRNVEVRLPAAPMIVLTLPKDVSAELKENQHLAVALARESFDTAKGAFALPQAFERGVVELAAPARGRLSVHLMLMTTNDSGQRQSRAVTVDPPLFIDVPSTGSSAPIEVHVSVEDLRRALAAEKGRR